MMPAATTGRVKAPSPALRSRLNGWLPGDGERRARGAPPADEPAAAPGGGRPLPRAALQWIVGAGPTLPAPVRAAAAARAFAAGNGYLTGQIVDRLA